jgi:hypothetical protein
MRSWAASRAALGHRRCGPEGHLTRRLFAAMVRPMAALPVPAG